MSDGMSRGYMAHVSAVERVQQTYGHLSPTDAMALLQHHRERAIALRAEVRALERQLAQHDDAFEDLHLLVWERRS